MKQVDTSLIIYFMGGVSNEEFIRINQKIGQIIGKEGYGLLINCGPPVKRNKFAPYAIPIFIAMNFSDSTMKLELDSIYFPEGRTLKVDCNVREE